MSKNEFTPETRETLRQYVINNRETYEAITAQARQLAGIVAETAAKAHALDLSVGNPPHEGAGFVGKRLAEVQQDIGPAFRESIAFDAGTERRGDLGLDTVIGKHD